MVKFETSRFGTLEVEDDRIINFPDGLLGLPDNKRYILLDYKDTPLKWLQAVDNPQAAFIVLEPTVLSPDYSINLDPRTRKYLQLENDNDLAVIVIIRVEAERVIANFRGPILLNANLMKGIQIVMDRVNTK